jgi:hypothetical protein
MAYEPRAGSLSLFKNDRKEQPNHPDYKGDGLDLDGRPVWVSAWVKEGAKGKFFSIALKAKEARQDSASDFRGGSSSGVAGSRETGRAAEPDPFADDIPFISRDSIR